MSVGLPPLLAGLEVLDGTGPEFGGFLAHHGPMACETLVALGLGDAAPGRVARYRSRLEAAPGERFRLDSDDYQGALGAPIGWATGSPCCADCGARDRNRQDLPSGMISGLITPGSTGP